MSETQPAFSHPFIQGSLPKKTTPLARFLPPVPSGVAAAWLSEQVEGSRISPGGWVLDPFGASPRLAVEMARHGWRVLVASNNPIDRFLLDLFARPPAEAELRSALADLGATTRGDTRIEPHLRSLYNTTCDECRQEVMAEAFIWQRGEPTPVGRIYQCPYCGNAGEFPATPADASHLDRITGGGLHRARALERVAPLDDPDRPLVEEALDTYLPRALYALFILINKMEGLPGHLHRPLSALILAAFDQANTLWPHPGQRARPRLLAIPPQFRENNVWLALEEAVSAWSQSLPDPDEPLALVHWPRLPPESGGICLFDGRLRELNQVFNEQQPEINLQALVGALPRPNQAYWTLSALWAGWLWGREAAAPFKLVLRRRRYDWGWHTAALTAAWENLPGLFMKGAPVLGLVAECEPGFISAALLSAGLAGLTLEGAAFRHDQAQLYLSIGMASDQQSASSDRQKPPADEYTSQPATEKSAPEDQDVNRSAKPAQLQNVAKKFARESGEAYLLQTGEPASYLHIHTAALVDLAMQPEIVEAAELAPQDAHSQVQAAFQSTYSSPGWIRYGGSQHSLEVGLWWKESLPKSPPEQEQTHRQASLGDRVEMEIVRLLLKSSQISFEALDQSICQAFPGLLTPESDLVEAVVDSYCEIENDLLRLRDGEKPEQRRRDLAELAKLLSGFGHGMGLNAQVIEPERRWIVWRDAAGELQAAFYLLPSAVISPVLASPAFPAEKCVLVFPGGRAGLIAHKLRRDPRLRQLFESGWRAGKFRHIRRLAQTDDVTIENLSDRLLLDPIDRQDPQMAMI